jgi:NTE family protein
LRTTGLEHTRKIVFVVVNAEAEAPTEWSQRKRAPKMGGILTAATTVTISRYNFETLELLRQNAAKWAQDIHTNRCLQASGAAAGVCADIKFYLVEINFDALKNEQERFFLKGTPSSFRLPAEVVDRLQNAGAQLLVQSDVYQQLLRDLSETQAQ